MVSHAKWSTYKFLSKHIVDRRKDIYIEGRNGAVVRDVLVFTTTNSQQPDDTDQTLWTLTARVYFDWTSVEDEGILQLQRLDGEFSARVSVSFRNETLDSGVYREISIDLTVKPFTNNTILTILNDLKQKTNLAIHRVVKPSCGGQMVMEILHCILIKSSTLQ